MVKISSRGYGIINVTLERFVNVVDGVPIVTVVLSLSEATAPKMYKNTSNRIMFDFIKLSRFYLVLTLHKLGVMTQTITNS